MFFTVLQKVLKLIAKSLERPGKDKEDEAKEEKIQKGTGAEMSSCLAQSASVGRHRMTAPQDMSNVL